MIRIDVLPDDALLGVFDFYVDTGSLSEEVEAWQSLVHVCRRWRRLVLGSPRRLNLQLCCTPRTPAKENLDIWPTLPLIVRGDMTRFSGTDNIVAALWQSNRVCKVDLWEFGGWQLREVLAAMQVPFPELTDLQLSSNGETMPAIPDSFLDGSATRLRRFALHGIPFLGLPKLLPSATHLVHLDLFGIPHSGYISPEAIVVLVSVLSGLETLHIGFQSPQSCPEREIRRLFPSKRCVLPVLAFLRFTGFIEYLEVFVTGIDAPQLGRVQIFFFNQFDFDTPRLAQFINRTPKLGKRDATVQFNDDTAVVGLLPGTLRITIICIEPDWQLSSIEQLCHPFSQLLSTVENLYIEHHYLEVVWKNDSIENTLWLQLLVPFTAVINLFSIKGNCARYRGRSAGARWGQDSRSVAQPAEYFREGTRAIRTFPGNDWAVCCGATTL